MQLLISTNFVSIKCYASIMRYIFYADVYFVHNFMIKVAVLYLTLYWNKAMGELEKGKGIAKLCMVSGVATFVEVVGLLFFASYQLFVVVVNCFEVPLMVLVLLGKERKGALRVIFGGYFFLILINGVLEALWNQFGEHGSYIFYLLFSCGVVLIGVRMWKNYSKTQKGIYRIELMHKGKRIQINGLYDSGNCLKDTYSGKGVHIASRKAVEQLELGEAVYLPYKALGNEQGVLEVYYIDEMCIWGEKGRINIQNCPLGVTKDNLFEGKNYEIILNEEVF